MGNNFLNSISKKVRKTGKSDPDEPVISDVSKNRTRTAQVMPLGIHTNRTLASPHSKAGGYTALCWGFGITQTKLTGQEAKIAFFDVPSALSPGKEPIYETR